MINVMGLSLRPVMAAVDDGIFWCRRGGLVCVSSDKGSYGAGCSRPGGCVSGNECLV